MENSQICVIDTNILFMALTNPFGKAAKILDLANLEKIILFAPDSVKQEIEHVLIRENKINDSSVLKVISGLPVKWVNESFYGPF